MKTSEFVVFRSLVFGVLLSDVTVRAGQTTDTSRNKTTFVPGTAAVNRNRVVLTISASNLRGKDKMSKSDPMCVIFGQSFDSTKWIERGRTETIQDNHNPDFLTKIKLEYNFEVLQPLRFQIYDIDSNHSNLDTQDFLGFAKTTLGKIVHDRKVELELNLNKNEMNLTDDEIAERRIAKVQKNMNMNTGKDKANLKSKITIWAEKYKNGDQDDDNLIIMDLEGTKIAGKSWYALDRSNPYIDIYKATNNEATDYVLVHRMEAKTFSVRPHWRRFSIFYSALADEDPNRKLKFVCKDWSSVRDHSYIGEFVTSVLEIKELGKNVFELKDPKKEKSASYKNSGIIHINQFEIVKTSSFLDYVLESELDINCIIGIDFTASNGHPRYPYSLHYIQKGRRYLNQYEQAITGVVSILEDYDSDKLFPTYGYGAKIPPRYTTSHNFPVNFNDTYPYCAEVNGVLEAYRNCVHQITLSGPTYFNPVVRNAVEIARGYKKGKNYAILLILTDGQINDMKETTRTIIEGSKLPLSIIIIGVGNANFDSMEELDADSVPLQSRGKTAERDIVQFVPFNKFFTTSNDPVAKARLAKEVLAEIPKQLITYMVTNKIKPKPRRIDSTSKPDTQGSSSKTDISTRPDAGESSLNPKKLTTSDAGKGSQE